MGIPLALTQYPTSGKFGNVSSMTIWAPAAHSGLAHGMGIYITRRYTKNENKIRGIQREIVLPNGFSDFPRGGFPISSSSSSVQALVKKKNTLYPTTVTTVTSCSSIYRIERKEGLGLRESVRGSSDRETTLQPASKQPVDVQLEHVIRNWSNSGSASSMTRKSCIVHCVLNIMMSDDDDDDDDDDDGETNHTVGSPVSIGIYTKSRSLSYGATGEGG